MKKLVLYFLCAMAIIPPSKAQSLPSLIPYFDGHKWGYADTNGRVVIKPIWRRAAFFEGDRAHVYTEKNHCTIDRRGAYIIPPYRDWNGKLYSSLVGSYYNAKSKDGKWGVIDSNNHEMLPCLYDQTEFGNTYSMSGTFSWDKRANQYAATACKNGKFGIIDTLNNVLIPFKYDGIYNAAFALSPKYYQVRMKEQRFGLVDSRNRVIIPPIYRNVQLDGPNDNQIMIYKDDNTTVIADTTGRIVLAVPGYTLGFPAHSLIPVADSTGNWGLMNYNRKFMIPCEYLGVWLQHDTIVVSKWITDSANIKAQHFKHYDVNHIKEISGWLNWRQYTRQPPAPTLIAGTKKLPYRLKMHIGGKDLEEYQQDSILWFAADYSQTLGYMISVRGIAINDTVARFAAILDSNGKYAVAPQQTSNKLKVINSADSLILIEEEHAIGLINEDYGTLYEKPFPRSLRCVADYQLKPILPFQPLAIATAFYYQHVFYAITKHGYTYFLTTADGQPAKGMKPYKLCYYADALGYPVTRNNDNYPGQGFSDPFQGYFMAEDSQGKKGFVSIYGEVLLPKLSFKYEEIRRIGPNVFLVNDKIEKGREYYSEDLLSDQRVSLKDKNKLLRGFPYLVDGNNHVLLDSLSVEYAGNVTAPSDAPLYNVGLKRIANYSIQSDDIGFYMDNKGRAYHGKLPGDKKQKLERKESSFRRKHH